TAVQGLWEVGAESIVLQEAGTADPWTEGLELALLNLEIGLKCGFTDVQTRLRKLQICEAGSVFTTGTEAGAEVGIERDMEREREWEEEMERKREEEREREREKERMIDRKVYLIPLNRDWETERRRERAWSKSMGRDGGVFGSLLVQLPAQHEGGDLVIIHMGAARRIHTAAESADACYYTAFYAGCLHSPQPVTSGLRLVLTYDLVFSPADGMGGAVARARPTAPVPADWRTAEDKTARLMSALQSWICDTDNAPKRLCARLENSSNFMSKNRTLGGSDRQMVNALKALVDPHTQEPLLQDSRPHKKGKGGGRKNGQSKAQKKAGKKARTKMSRRVSKGHLVGN
ncbi:hypothetical protein B484DRAFT_403321, partial [Ochromonadaceae sp. CCMP2298]